MNKLLISFIFVLIALSIVPISLACNSDEIPVKYAGENYCIRCSGAVTENEGQLSCIACEPNFELRDGLCVPSKYQATTMSAFDVWLQKTIPSTNYPYLPYIIVIVVIVFVVYIIQKNQIKFKI